MRHLLAFTALVAASLASAQNAFDAYVANIVILQAKNVQKEIGITDAQRGKMNKLADADRTQRTALMNQFQKEAEAAKKAGKEYQPDMTKVAALNASLKRGIIAELTAAQLKRLRELSLQDAGIIALMDDTVAKEAGVPSATVAKLRTAFEAGAKQAQAVQEAEAKKIFAQYKDKKPKNDAEANKWRDEALQKLSKIAGPKVAAIQQATKAKMTGYLTAAQKAKFIALQGKPFKG